MRPLLHQRAHQYVKQEHDGAPAPERRRLAQAWMAGYLAGKASGANQAAQIIGRAARRPLVNQEDCP